jgi:hypothetical protein
MAHVSVYTPSGGDGVDIFVTATPIGCFTERIKSVNREVWGYLRRKYRHNRRPVRWSKLLATAAGHCASTSTASNESLVYLNWESVIREIRTLRSVRAGERCGIAPFPATRF